VKQSSNSQAQLFPLLEKRVVSTYLKVRSFMLRFLRFGIVGVLNAAIDILALNFLLWRFPTHSTTTIIVYNTFAYMLGAINSYLLNKYWTFRRGTTVTGDELLRFITVNVIGIVSNDALFWLIARMLHPSLANLLFLTNASKVSAIIGTAFISYIGMHFLVFRQTEHERQTHKKDLP
jgi:putative flippase GtrA